MAAGSAETAGAARLFVAVRPPPATLDLIASLTRTTQRGVRWTRREQWHATLVFLAQADPDEVRRQLRSLDAPPVVATLGTTAVSFGRSAIGLPVEGLAPLAGAVNRAGRWWFPIGRSRVTSPSPGPITDRRAAS